MRINETTLGLDCEVVVRKLNSREDEIVTKHTFFGIENSREGAETIVEIARRELEANGFNPDDYQIFVK